MQLVLSIILCLILYFLFENYGFKEVFIFKLVWQIIKVVIAGAFQKLYALGVGTLIIYFVILIISILITTAIEHFIYNKTSGFIAFVILSGLIEMLILVGASAALYGIVSTI